MPTEVILDTIPEFQAALRELIESGLEIRPWDNAQTLLQGFSTDEKRILVRLSTVRAHYRMDRFEPYDAGLKRWREDLAKIFRDTPRAKFEVGRRIVSRPHGKESVHRGTIEEVTDCSITIRHDDDCCEPGVLSTVDLAVAAKQWRQIIVRRSAWERLLDDD